jgi:hypothetical protein
MMLDTTTNPGLHDFVAEQILSRYARTGVRAVDLGSGPGAMAGRLKSMGCEVVAANFFPGDSLVGDIHFLERTK